MVISNSISIIGLKSGDFHERNKLLPAPKLFADKRHILLQSVKKRTLVNVIDHLNSKSGSK